ncbi:MAG: cytochrome C oxidase Cbb3, partial [Pseudomonadota bacterium]|nr:cytochrome C oxidase Cbb3 [Pseudomonadota bacterium]
YVLHPSNVLAYEMLTQKSLNIPVGETGGTFDADRHQAERLALMARLCAVPDAQRDIFLGIYANPVIAKLQQQS